MKVVLSATKQSLLMLLKLGYSISEFMYAVSFYQYALSRGGMDQVRTIWAVRERRVAQRQIARLKKQKWIEVQQRGDEMMIRLTDLGMLIALRAQMRLCSPCPKGECVLVTFDIPETQRSLRLHLRRFLRECGFLPVQKSVWTCDRDVAELFDVFIDRIGARPWVSVFRVVSSQLSVSSKKQNSHK